jgi:membrane associated rhomboid family serine protease
MAELANDLLEVILRDCATIAPEPWYPAEFSKATGVPREVLDPYLDQLRLAGLLRLTDWVAGHGQGYALTPSGEDVLQRPRLLARLRTGALPPRPAEPADGQPSTEVPRSEWDRADLIRQELQRPGPARVTGVLIFSNLLVFLIGCGLASRANLSIDDFLFVRQVQVLQVLHDTGAVSRPDIAVHHEWWRLLSCCFVHIGLLHLGVNMYSLYAVGPLLERMWGEARFILLYLIAGLCGSCAMVQFQTNPNTVGAGASGALWGIMGSMAAWIVLNRRYLPPALASGWMRQLLFILLLNVAITFGVPDISASAHFGGGIAGAAVAVPLHFLRYGRGWQRGLAVAGTAAIPLVFFILMVRTFTDEEVRVEQARQDAIRQAEQARQEAQRQAELEKLEPEELAQINKLIREVQKLETAARKVFTKYVVFSGEDPPKPKQATAKEAADALEKVCNQELAEAIKILRQAGPYRNAWPEKGRQTRLKVLEARLDLYRLAVRLLRGEEPWNRTRWEELNQRLSQAEADWRKMVRLE